MGGATAARTRSTTAALAIAAPERPHWRIVPMPRAEGIKTGLPPPRYRSRLQRGGACDAEQLRSATVTDKKTLAPATPHVL